MELSFSSASPCLGRQIDSFYDNGYKAECSIDGEDLEFIVLFSKEHSDFVDNLGAGNDFEVSLRVLGYDSLYKKPILGALLEEEVDENILSDAALTNEVVSEKKVNSLNDSTSQVEPQVEPKVEPIEVEPQVEPQVAMPQTIQSSESWQSGRSDDTPPTPTPIKKHLNFKKAGSVNYGSGSSSKITLGNKIKVIKWGFVGCLIVFLGLEKCAINKEASEERQARMANNSAVLVKGDGNTFVRDGLTSYKTKKKNLGGGRSISYYIDNNKRAHIVSIMVSNSQKVLKIPAVIDGFPVLRIREKAARFRGAPITIELSEGIQEIGDYAFYGSRFKMIVLPKTITKIGNYAFGGDRIREVVFKGSPPLLGNGRIGGRDTTLFFDAKDSAWTEQDVERIGRSVRYIRSIDGSLIGKPDESDKADKAQPEVKDTSESKIDEEAKIVLDEIELLVSKGEYAKAQKKILSKLAKMKDLKDVKEQTLQRGHLNKLLGLCYERVKDLMAAYRHYVFAYNHYNKVSKSQATVIKTNLKYLSERLVDFGLVVEEKVIDPRSESGKKLLLDRANNMTVFENRGDNEYKIFLPNKVEGYTGWVKVLHPDGKLKELLHYSRGWKHGVSYSWYDDGKIQERRNFFRGNLFGLYQAWSAKGEMTDLKFYSRGVVQN